MKRIGWWWLAGAMSTALGCSDSPPATPSDDVPQDTKPVDVPVTPDATPEDVAVDNGQPDVATDTTPTCGTGEQLCGTSCVNTQNSNDNCGACGTMCPAGQSCTAGACAMPMTCPSGQSLCGTTCVDTAASNENCGACGNACATGTTCAGGTCTAPVVCPTGQTSCAGVCVNTQTDATNCGTCGTVCPAGQSCTAGACRATTTCTGTQVACGGSCVDTMTDLNNCGGCGTVCAAGQVCTAGVCGMMACPAGQTRCGSACVNTSTDASNCMVCGRTCAAGQTCAAGVCTGSVTCPAGQTSCGTGTSAACADLATDPANCGACGTICAAGQTCTARTCTAPRAMCPTGQTDCAPTAPAPSCVNIATSNANCGACGNACPTGQTCVGSACTCATGQLLCGRTCVNPATDSANCGACGRACPTGQSCTAGACACATGQRLCSGACVNTATDNNNCGACGTVCPAGQACTAGACACPTGQRACTAGGVTSCVNTATDRANCGACGTVCAMGQTCTAGACACPTGQVVCGTGTAATCVDRQTNAANCGTCGNRCATGTSCTAGVCRGTPPANDTRTGATLINLAMPAQTLSADTTAATNNTTGSCRCTGGNDVYFRFVLTAPEVVYADTFGSTVDTALFFQDSAGANITATAPNVTCNDDHQMAGFCTGTVGSNLQSQIAARLGAGTYYLVLSGCSAGASQIHFQHLPAGNGASARINPTATEQTATGTTSGTGTVASTCCSGGADNSHWWITCPGTAAANFYASTCNAGTGVSLVGYDVEIAQYSALRATSAVCNDDVGGAFTCGTGSSLGSSIPATGATLGGLNTLIADSCSGAGAYTVRYVLAAPCATGSRCGAACVDTNTNVNNCGGCDRRCATGNICVAGACIAPPANDAPAGAVTINMTLPQSTFTVDTRAAVNNTSGSCSCTTGSDIFYNFTVPATGPEIIYADTIGSNYDTSLFVQTAAGANIAAAGLTNGLACNDDAGLAGCAAGLQSQIMLQLPPGAYRLVVSGCSTGTANVRFQHAPVGNGATAFVAAGSSTPVGVVSGTGRVNFGCNAGGPENTYYWYTCPSATTAGTFTASTCGRASWDTSLAQYSPGRTTPGASVCADDSCGLQSSVTATIPAGPGLHLLYVDTFTGRTAGGYSVSIARP